MADDFGWVNVENRKESNIDLNFWSNRVAEIAHIINESGANSVLDLGCGNMGLKSLISAECQYYPVDYCTRGIDTIICDFNKQEFPNVHAEVVVGSGVLEHIDDYEWFIKCMCEHSYHSVIVSYAFTDGVNPNERRTLQQNGYRIEWKNSLSVSELESMFNANQFRIKSQRIIPIRQVLIEFIRSEEEE